MYKVLVVDDDETLRLTVRATLESRQYNVTEAADGIEALESIKTQGPFDFVLLDVNMPRMTGMEALGQIKELNPRTVVIVMTAYSKIQDAIAAIKLGAYDYLEKPVEGERILKLIDSAIEASSMVEVAAFSAPQLQAPQLEFDEGRNMIGASNSIRKVFDIIYKLSKVDTSVLIRGESGTGKELVARALHFNSHRKKGPFVAVNCGAIPENLIESELFGHEKGAFTGADKKKLGKFQYAIGGTIFLDEIGDISPQLQVKLLRVLQEKRITPVGSNTEMAVDVRVISATNRNLEKMIEEGKFREDLFYRLNVLPIHLPSLRDRREDIPALIQFLIKKFNTLHGKAMKGIHPEALQALKVYNCPGNIRELENIIEHAFIIESSDQIQLDSLPLHIQTLFQQKRPIGAQGAPFIDDGAGTDGVSTDMMGDETDLNYPALKEKFEKEFIQKALKAYNGRINQTAEHTQMTKVTLLRKLEKYGINPKEYRN